MFYIMTPVGRPAGLLRAAAIQRNLRAAHGAGATTGEQRAKLHAYCNLTLPPGPRILALLAQTAAQTHAAGTSAHACALD